HGPGHRYHHPGGRVRPRLPPAPGRADLRHPAAAEEDQGGELPRSRPARGAPAPARWALPAGREDRRGKRAVREQRAPDEVGVTEASPSVAALRARFGGAILRHLVSCGDTIVYVEAARLLEVMTWLRDDPGQRFDYLTDVTAVEYRDQERPLEVVWQLRSLGRKADLRVKVELDQRQPLVVASVFDL